MKERLDVLLVKRNLAESREKAKAVIMSGIVYVDGQKEDKAGSMFDETANVEVRGTTLKYVSRGGLKLEKAMTHFGVTLEGKICMDVGASTGGFTDCMLQNGAVKVYSVDVGHGQLAWKLRNDERVVCMEKTNIRYVTPEEIPDRIQFVSIDVSFISLTKVLGPVKALMEPDGQLMILTPICPHTLTSRTIVFGADSRIRIEIPATNRGSQVAAFDGDTLVRLENGDYIEITKAETVTRVVKLDHRSFLDILKMKMYDA